MAVYRSKPASPIWQPGQAPAGCVMYLPFYEGAGGVARDLCRKGGTDVAFTGSPTWGSGAYGPQLGGFSTTKYASLIPSSQLIGVGFPLWIACLATNTGTAITGVPFTQRSSSSTIPLITLAFNESAVANSTGYDIRADDGGIASPRATIAAASDGLPHVLMGVSYTSTDHRFYFDGVQRASSVTPIGTLTANTIAIGAAKSTSVGSPLVGSVIAAAMGVGAVPNPMALAQDWLTGRFAAVRPRRVSVSFASLTATMIPWHLFQRVA